MKRLIGFIILSCSVFFSPAQQQNGLGPKEKSVRSEVRSERRARKEDREKRKQEKEERRFVEKHHKRIQTKEVRKRMKHSKVKAQRQHDNKREFVGKRWFAKKHAAKTKVKKKD